MRSLEATWSESDTLSSQQNVETLARAFACGLIMALSQATRSAKRASHRQASRLKEFVDGNAV